MKKIQLTNWSLECGRFHAKAMFSILLVLLFASSISMVNVALAQTPPDIISYKPLDKTFVDPYVTVGSPTIEIQFSKAMNTSSVEDATMFLREQFAPGLPTTIPEIEASLSAYQLWFPGQFLVTWADFNRLLQISFKGDLQSPTGNMLTPDGKYRLTITDNQAKDWEDLPLQLTQIEYIFYVPGYGNVDLSDQGVSEYVTLNDAQTLAWHVADIPNYNIFDNFAAYANPLSQDLAIEIANVDASTEEPPEDRLTLNDAQYIAWHVADIPGYEEFPAATQASPAPGLQPAQTGNVVVSLGELTDPNDCSSVITPIVIAIGQGVSSVEVPINICNLDGREIDNADIRIQYDQTVAKATSVRLGDIIPNPEKWTLTPNDSTPGTYIITLWASVAPDPIISDGAIVYVTFEAVSTDPKATTTVNLTKANLQDNIPGSPPEILPVEIVGNDIALPVNLSALGAVWHPDGGIRIFWEAESQRENLGWNIYRSETKDGKFVKLNGELIEGAGTTAISMKYHFVDKDIISGKSYFYYLEDISFFGEKHRSYIIKATLMNQLTSWGAIKNSSLRQIPLAAPRGRNPVVLVKKVYDAKGNLARNKK